MIFRIAGMRKTGWNVDAYIDFAFLSCSDLNDEGDRKLCRKLYEKGCSVVTATRGSKGATVLMGERFYCQLPDYLPVDTMGGDSFATAMLITILKSWKHNRREAGKTVR